VLKECGKICRSDASELKLLMGEASGVGTGGKGRKGGVRSGVGRVHVGRGEMEYEKGMGD